MRMLIILSSMLFHCAVTFAAQHESGSMPINKLERHELIAMIERLKRTLQMMQANMDQMVSPAVAQAQQQQIKDAQTIAELHAKIAELEARQDMIRGKEGEALIAARAAHDQLARAERCRTGISDEEVVRRIARATEEAEKRADALAHQLAEAQRGQDMFPDGRVQKVVHDAIREREIFDRQLKELRSLDGWLFHTKGLRVWVCAALIAIVCKKGNCSTFAWYEKRLKRYMRKKMPSPVIMKYRVARKKICSLQNNVLQRRMLYQKSLKFTKDMAHRVSCV